MRRRSGRAAPGKARGAIRQRFSSAIHVDLTRLSRPEWERFEAELGTRIGFRKHGYIPLTSDPDPFASIGGGDRPGKAG